MVFAKGIEFLFRDESTLSDRRQGVKFGVGHVFEGQKTGRFGRIKTADRRSYKGPNAGRNASLLHETRYAKQVTQPRTFSSNLCSMSVRTTVMETSMTTGMVMGRLRDLGVLLRPENYLVVLFAISTTLWTVAFLFYILSTQLGAFVATVVRSAHLRRARA